MNILDARILLKRSTDVGVVPTIPASSSHTDGSWINTDIYSGEVFLNTHNERMFVRTGDNINELTFNNHWIGKSYGGGIVFHVYRDQYNVEHGLIVSIVNQSTSSTYSNIDNQSIGASSTWDGQQNTALMAAQTGATSGAWKFADDYSYGGFTDWYLPAIDELKLLSSNRYNVNKTLSNILGATQVLNNFYWSSTQYSNTSAYYLSFDSGDYSTTVKSNTLSVRAIRQF